MLRWLALGVLFLLPAGAAAQMFDASVGVETDNKPAVSRPQAASNQGRQVFVPKSELPKIERPTLDGTDRGRVAVHAVVADKDEARRAEEGMIFVFYKDFKVSRMMNKSVTCDVTFVVLTTLDRKLSNLSIKLKWPEMLTTLSYDDVAPNTETVYHYTLLGQGCYSMDKVPNIIVNRCRVAGLSQQDCAAKIRWIKKN